MKAYRPAGQEFQFSCPVLELTPFGVADQTMSGIAPASPPLSADSTSPTSLLAQTDGLVGGSIRHVETWSALSGYILKVSGGSSFFVSMRGERIQRIGDDQPWPQLDREILVGPVLVLALALRNVWSMHASAVTCNGRALLFVGESGRGKSTLAAFLASTGDPESRLVSDDILPVTIEAGLTAWPHFPQLKLPLNEQPGTSLPDQLPVGAICLLGESATPSLVKLSASSAVPILLGHTAGTRIFPPVLLADHLAFCAKAAKTVPVYHLSYPRRMDALPDVEKLLETIC